jgi:hypothetical protein
MGHETWDTTGTWDMGHRTYREWEHGGHGTMYRDTGLWTWSWGIPLYFPQGTLLNIVGQQCPPMSPRVPSCPLMCPPMSPHVPPCPTIFTSRVITSRLSGWLLKKEKSWARLLRFLPEHARKRHQQCGLPLQHAVLQEVWWSGTRKTRHACRTTTCLTRKR